MGEFSFSSDSIAPGETQTISYPLQKPKQKSMKKTGSVSGSIALTITKVL